MWVREQQTMAFGVSLIFPVRALIDGGWWENIF